MLSCANSLNIFSFLRASLSENHTFSSSYEVSSTLNPSKTLTNEVIYEGADASNLKSAVDRMLSELSLSMKLFMKEYEVS